MSEIRCPKCGSEHVVGVEIRGLYDGVAYWRCAVDECGEEWHRFPEGSWLHARVASHFPALRVSGERVHDSTETK